MDTIDNVAARKRAMFSQLDALNEANDSVPDEGYQTSVLALSDFAKRYKNVNVTRGKQIVAPPMLMSRDSTLKRSTSLVEMRSSVKNSRVDLLKRSETTPRRTNDTAISNEVVMIKDTPLPPRAPSNVVAAVLGKPREYGEVMSSSTNVARITGKRKRASRPPPVPEDQQIFRGLTMSLRSPHSERGQIADSVSVRTQQ